MLESGALRGVPALGVDAYLRQQIAAQGADREDRSVCLEGTTAKETL